MEPSHRNLTLAEAHAKIDTHERVCAERYGNINSAITDLKALMKWSFGFVLAMAASLGGFMAHELYANAQERLRFLERASVSTPSESSPIKAQGSDGPRL